MHTRQFYVIGIYNHFPLCLVFAYPPIVRIPELQKKMNGAAAVGIAKKR